MKKQDEVDSIIRRIDELMRILDYTHKVEMSFM
jgi:hypothetical protein